MPELRSVKPETRNAFMVALLATYCKDIAKGLWAVAMGMKITFRQLVAPTPPVACNW